MTALTQRMIQRDEALLLANTVRSHNHRCKLEIAAMPRNEAFATVAQILESPDGPVGAIPVHQALEAVARVGPDTARRLLLRAGVYLHTRRIRDLTLRQRRTLADLLREKAEVCE